MKRPNVVLGALYFSLLLAGCGEVKVTVAPATVTVEGGRTQAFTATVDGAAEKGVTWSVEEGAGGTINAEGVYTAPTAAGTFHVVATSRADVNKKATATVTVTEATVIQLSPSTVALTTGGTQTFSATLGGAAHAVTWSVQEGTAGGTITPAGVYSAPGQAGTYHVVALSKSEDGKRAVATVTVTASGVAIAISPTTATLSVGQTQAFTATVTGSTNTAVLWSVEEGAAGGQVNGAGLYTAPAAAGTYHVLAASSADPSQIARATVTVAAGVGVTIDPKTLTMLPNGTQAFTATVTGATNKAVSWNVQEAGGGVVNPNGVYTAPSRGGTFHVVATSVEDPTKSAIATVTISGPVTVVITPAVVTLAVGATRQFAATVTGAANPAVTWTVQEATGGTVSVTGLYTAPSTTGTFHVIATSVEDTTKKAVATVTVNQGVVVVLTPTTVSLVINTTQQFTGYANGGSSSAVTWSVQEANGGTISAGGLYTAPATAGTYHVIATSVSDPSKSATATLTVKQVGVTVSPAAVSVTGGQTQQFSATVVGSANPAVTWTATGGTISATGLFTAPAAAGNYSVTATSVADATSSGSATVTVLPPPGTVSGVIQYSGAKTGRIYITVSTSSGVALGTSIAAPGAFTVRGISAAGGYTVEAFMDTAANFVNDVGDPRGSVAFNYSGTSVTGVAVTLADAPAVNPPPALTNFDVIGADGAALVTWGGVMDSAGAEQATSYALYWSQSANPGPANNLGSKVLKPSGENGVAFVTGLTPGNYYFGLAARIGTVEGAVLEAPASLNAGSGAGTLSGSVSSSGITGASLYVIAVMGTATTLDYRVTRVTGASPASYSFAKLLPGTYQMAVLADVNNDGQLSAGDLMGDFAFVAVAGTAVTAPSLVLSTSQARAQSATELTASPGSNQYNLSLHVQSNLKVPVKVTLTAGPGLQPPYDLALSASYSVGSSYEFPASQTAPTAGAVYTFDVTYSDGTTGTQSVTVTPAAPIPVMTSPVGTSNGTPTFTWSYPTALPATAFQTLSAFSSGGGGWYLTLPQNVTSIAYNADGSATIPTLPPGTANWGLTVGDGRGNTTSVYGSWTVQ